MVCDGLSSLMGCCDGHLGSNTWLGEQRREAWSIAHNPGWIKVGCTRMLRALLFAPSTLFTLEITCKYTQPCAIYHWGPTQFHHSRVALGWIWWSSGGKIILICKLNSLWWFSSEFTVVSLTLLISSGMTCLLAAKPYLLPVYSWYHCTCDKSCGTSPRRASCHFDLPYCGLTPKPLLFLPSSFSSIPLHFLLIYLQS